MLIILETKFSEQYSYYFIGKHFLIYTRKDDRKHNKTRREQVAYM